VRLDRAALRQLPRHKQIELEENVQRKDLSESEKAYLQRDMLEVVRVQAQPGDRRDLTGETAFSQDDQATAVVGRPFGESHKQVERRQAVLAAAEADPERYGHLLDLMDRTGQVRPAFEQLTVLRRQQEHAQRTQHGCTVTDLFALADSGQRNGVVYADPAWHDGNSYRSAASHYPTMSLQEIADLPIARLLADDAALLMWCPGHHVALGNRFHVEETDSLRQRRAHRAGLVDASRRRDLPACHQGRTATAGE
jgi:MT-A70